MKFINWLSFGKAEILIVDIRNYELSAPMMHTIRFTV